MLDFSPLDGIRSPFGPRRGGPTPAFSPTALFALAEPGIWLDPSDVANLDWRRNLLLWSEQISNAVYIKAAVTSVTPTAGAAPNGTSSADLVLFAAGGRLGQAITVAANSTVSATLRVKRVNRDYHVLAVAASNTSSTNSATARFNLQTLALENTENLGTGFAIVGTPTITASTNGYVVLSVQATVTGTAAALYTTATEGTTQNTASAGAECYLWGAQLELGSTATEYQPITDLNTEVIALFPNATMFQDRAGSTLVTTPGQFVGVRLDKSKGLTLGSEIVTNGTFDTDTSGWTANLLAIVTWVSGQMSVQNTVADARYKASQAVTCVVGRTYQLRVECTSGAPNIRVNDNASPIAGTILINTTSAGVLVFTATATTQYIHVGPQGIGTAIFDNISAKELAGNHAVAPTDAARMTYGIEPKTGTRNIFTFSEDFSNAVWTKTDASIASSAVPSPIGSLTSQKLVEAATTARHFLATSTSILAALTQQTITFYAQSAGRTRFNMLFSGGNGDWVWFDLTSGAATVGLGVTNNISCSMVSVGSGWWRCAVTLTTVAAGAMNLCLLDGSTPTRLQSYAGDGTSGILIGGAQLELGTSATAYQRVTTASDVTEAGVASCHYCQYDGTDDSMSTAAIAFTSTDAVSVFAGIRKSSDATLGTVLEFGTDSTNNNGSFSLRSPNTTASAAYSYVSRGTALSLTTSPASFAAPRYNLLTGLCDISADQSVLRVNGVQVSSNTADQGTGNYANQALFIGRRNNTSQSFSGRDYGIIVVGKAVSAGDLASTETWLAAKTAGVTL